MFWNRGDFSLRFTSFEMTSKNNGHFGSKRRNLIVLKRNHTDQKTSSIMFCMDYGAFLLSYFFLSYTKNYKKNQGFKKIAKNDLDTII